MAFDLLKMVTAAAQAPSGDERLTWRMAAADPEHFAHDLYARLRELDALGVDLILVAAPPGDERWRAVARYSADRAVPPHRAPGR
jgi:L-threonylcarbamoyladenylate synthase